MKKKVFNVISADNENSGILSGVRVLEWGNSRACKLAGMLLADQGAEVVRIINSDEIDDENTALSILNRRKKGIRLDTDNQDDIDHFVRLIRHIDIFIEDLGDYRLKEKGINLSQIRSDWNHGLIACSLHGYLSSDPRSRKKWIEQEINVSAGVYEPSLGIGKPRYFSLPVVSTYQALHAVNAVVMALIAWKRDGLGQDIEVPLEKAALSAQIFGYAIKSNPPTRWRPFQMLASPFMGLWKTSDNRHIYVHIGIPRHLRSFLFAIGKAGFEKEKRELKKHISKNTRRDPISVNSVVEAMAITRILKELFSRKEAFFWEDLLSNEGLCCSKVRTVSEWISHPQTQKSGSVMSVKDSRNRQIIMPGPLMDIQNGNSSLQYDNNSSEEYIFSDLIERWHRTGESKEKTDNDLPLEGVKVIDFSRVIAGPFTGKIFAEYGASVLHVTFREGHFLWEEPFNVAFNSGKESIFVDLKTHENRMIFRKIIDDFKPDIVIQNFNEASLKKLGIDYESFKRINEKVIYISISAYNSKGPWKNRTGFEWNIQATTGIQASYSSINNPESMLIPINDLCTGLIGGYGGSLAYYHLLNKNIGNKISVFLSTPSILLQIESLNEREENEKTLSQMQNDINKFYRAKDYWFLFYVKQKYIKKIMEMPHFAKLKKINSDIWNNYLIKLFRKKKLTWWKREIKKAGYENFIHFIAGKRIKSILKDELASRNPIFEYKQHKGLGKALTVNSPVFMSRTPVKNLSPAPYTGQDTIRFINSTGMKTGTVYHKPPEIKESRGVVPVFIRIWWILRQLKWVVVILYKYGT